MQEVLAIIVYMYNSICRIDENSAFLTQIDVGLMQGILAKFQVYVILL